MKMNIIIAGGSGLIGRGLVRSLQQSGYSTTILSRNPDKNKALNAMNGKVVSWDLKNPLLQEEFKGNYAVINLAGENISSGRWTPLKKQKIALSRIQSIEKLAESISLASDQPKVFVQGSAIGYYNAFNRELCNEDAPKGIGFLSDVVSNTEQKAKTMFQNVTRLIIIRTGIVYAGNGGAFPKLCSPYRFFAGGPVGKGDQWHSWIHIRDEVNAIRFLLEREQSTGIYNLCAPTPIQMKDLAQRIGEILNRPSWLPVPGIALKMVLGEMAELILLNGERAIPQKLLSEGFTFNYPEIESALKDLLS